MLETVDDAVPSSTQFKKPQYRKRPVTLKTKFESVFPIVRLLEPYYGDTTCPHNALCGLNRSMVASTIEPAKWQSTSPSPVFYGSLAEPKLDLCLELAKRKKLFIRNLTSIKQIYTKNKAKVETELKRIPEDSTNTVMVKKFAEALETDPDKYFNGNYDWYFTGGGMDIVDVDGQEFVVHSEGDQSQNLKISKLTSDCNINPTTTYDTKIRSLHKGNTIYEIKSVVDEPYFTVRQKHHLTVVNLRSDTLKLLKIHSEIPLVTSAVVPAMKLILIDAKQHLQLFNLIDVKPISRTALFANQMTIDNWSCARFIDSNQFVCASRKVVAVYDIRQSLEPVIEHDLTSFMGPCEDLTCLEQSTSGPNTFLATTHRLHALDMRNVKNGIAPALTWIHQLKTSPIFMDVSRNGSAGEMIAIAGIKSGDVKLLETTVVPGDGTVSTRLPYTPVSVHDAFKYAKSIGKFSDPNSLVPHQLLQSNTGVKLKRINANKFSLLIKNTCGDIFQQDIDSKDGTINCENHSPSISKMVNWDKELRSLRERDNKSGMKVTDITNFQSMVSYLRSNMHQDIPRPKFEANTAKQQWEMSVEELATYKDVLANSLLDRWVIAQDVQDVEMDLEYPDDRMSDWVESTVQQFHIFQEDICVKDEPEILEY